MLLAGFLSVAAAPVGADDSFDFRDGDRIVLLGGTFFEREGSEGYIETWLTRHSPHRSLTFRNLGYSGETVLGRSRAMFDTAEVGFKRMIQGVIDASPTVIVLAFGQNEAHEGEEGLEFFLTDYGRLIDILDASCTARFLLLSPTPLENLGPPLPDPTEQNRRLKVYSDALRGFAKDRGFFFVDLFEPLLAAYAEHPEPPWTDNTLHFTPLGYWRLAFLFGKALGLEEAEWRLSIDIPNSRIETTDTRIESFHLDPAQGLSLTLVDHSLPPPLPPRSASATITDKMPPRMLQVAGLPPQSYEIRFDDEAVGVFSEEEFSAGVPIPTGPQAKQVEELRGRIREKSQLFFYRWRPQNWTYLYGFRKYEQGQNAKETPMFDPLIADEEHRISLLRVPQSYSIHITPVEGGDAR